MKKEEFVQVWEAWDDQPGREAEATAMCNADMELGVELNLSHTDVRARLAEYVRQGCTKEQAFDALCSRGD